MTSKRKKFEDNVKRSFDAVHADTDYLFVVISNYERRLEKVEAIKKEIETNGVVSDIEKLKKENKTLRDALEGLRMSMDDKFRKLNTNGVVTEINKLKDEVFEDKRESVMSYLFSNIYGPNNYKPTLKSKVDAIIQYLGIDVSVNEKVEEVVAKKVTKKKGRK